MLIKPVNNEPGWPIFTALIKGAAAARSALMLASTPGFSPSSDQQRAFVDVAARIAPDGPGWPAFSAVIKGAAATRSALMFTLNTGSFFPSPKANQRRAASSIVARIARGGPLPCRPTFLPFSGSASAASPMPVRIAPMGAKWSTFPALVKVVVRLLFYSN
jgi:hypothetical protein